MKKTFIIFSLLTIVIIILITFLINSIIKDYSSDKDKYEINIGKHVILEEDTLLITDYSIWDNTYTLYNGEEINAKLLNNIEIIDKK